jgi:RNA polymerase sigma factor (sigma-70 family)
MEQAAISCEGATGAGERIERLVNELSGDLPKGRIVAQRVHRTCGVNSCGASLLGHLRLGRSFSSAHVMESYVRNHEDAEDALQDTLLRAYTRLTSFRRSCKFSTWLTAIGVNSALMILRKRRRRRETSANTSSLDTETMELQEFVDRSPEPEAIFLKQQAILLVRREVEKLLPSLRSAVNHYYGSDCSLKEAARAQKISLTAAKSRLLRGRVKLRSSLAGYEVSKSCDCVQPSLRRTIPIV